MKKHSHLWISIERLLFLTISLGIGGFWIYQLVESLSLQYAGEWERLSGFISWLMSYVLIVVGLLFLGWLNFKGPYTWWKDTQSHIWRYRIWQILLAFGIYTFLQSRTGFELEWVEENLLVTGLAFGTILGFTYIAAIIRNRNRQAKLLEQQAKAELNSLHAQLNPHFLFNALNMLYSQAIPLDDQRLAQNIQELSGILRFSLQQSKKEWVSVEEELSFLQRYINLQQARLADGDQLDIEISWDQSPAFIPPLLVLPFVENVFKYGIGSLVENPASIRLKIEEGQLLFTSQNGLQKKRVEGTGQGISLVERRLELIFPNQHTLSYGQEGARYEVELTIQLPTMRPQTSTTTHSPQTTITS